MSAFDTSGMASALPEASNPNANGAAVKLSGDELREKGWAQPQAFDYSADAPQPGEEALTKPDGEVQEVSGWAHDAAKYEWSEEYGDVGPRIPELEKQLFQSEFINRRGIKFDK